MDDTKRRLLTILFLLSSAAPLSRAQDLTYVTPAEVEQLRSTFASAHVTEDDLKVLTEAKGWRCDLYGVRTRLQVKREVDLYRFRALIPTPTYTNSGAQPITSYAVVGGALRGAGERGVVDEVRVTADKQLIAKLSIPERGVTIAYTRCRGS